MSNTRPPAINPATRSVWTSKDEAALLELVERKQRIMAERREPLTLLARSFCFDIDEEVIVNELINNAAELRDALEPFDGRNI